MQLEFKVLDEEIYFDNAEASQKYAKKNPGTVVVRSNGYHKASKTSSKKKLFLNISPSSIFNYLDKHIISQDDAKKEIAMTLYYHALKSKLAAQSDIKSNGAVMLVGPTGSGKTFIVQKACEFIYTIFIHVDTSSMVPEGIVGYSIGELGKDILKKANYNIQKASRCVIFFDEIDKIFNTDNKHGNSVSKQLLRLIEGAKIKLSFTQVELIKNPDVIKELDTSNMQFILGGAFQSIYDKKQSQKQYSIYHLSNHELKRVNEICLEDLYRENISKELLGRVSSIINLKKLTKDDYYQILTCSESSPLREFTKKVEIHGDEVTINDETIKQIACMAEKTEFGVRGMNQILKEIFKDALFLAPNNGLKTHNIIL